MCPNVYSWPLEIIEFICYYILSSWTIPISSSIPSDTMIKYTDDWYIWVHTTDRQFVYKQQTDLAGYQAWFWSMKKILKIVSGLKGLDYWPHSVINCQCYNTEDWIPLISKVVILFWCLKWDFYLWCQKLDIFCVRCGICYLWCQKYDFYFGVSSVILCWQNPSNYHFRFLFSIGFSCYIDKTVFSQISKRVGKRILIVR